MKYSFVIRVNALVLLLFFNVTGFSQSITSQKGLTTAVFNSSNGKINIYLPDDIRPGETITGTIVAEPTGKNAKQVNKNLEELLKNPVNIGDGKYTVDKNNKSFTFKVPAYIMTTSLLVNIPGSNSAGVKIPIQAKDLLRPAECGIPSHALTGAPVQIRGSFDGDASNTKVSVGNKPMQVLAESPGEIIVSIPPESKGIQTIQVQEKDKAPCIQKISGVQMKITAGKLNLKKGEKTYIDVSITGLEGLPDTAVLTLDNITPNIVVMQPLNQIVIPLIPAAVSSGEFNRRFDVNSIKTGDFTVNVNLDLPEGPIIYADNKGGIELHPLKVDGLKNGMSDAFKKAVIEVTGNSASKYPELDGCGTCLTCIQSMLDEGKVALVGEIGKILMEHYVDLLVGKAGGALAWVKDKFDKAEKAEDIASAIADAVAKNELQVVEFTERLCGYCLVSAIGFYDTKTGCMDAFFYCKGTKMCCTHALTIIHLKYCVNEDGYKKPDSGLTIDVISQ